MTTLIDRIMSKVKALRIKMKLENGYILEEGIRQILEAELTAVNGVDKHIKILNGVIENASINMGYEMQLRKVLKYLKALKQTPVASEEGVKGKCKICGKEGIYLEESDNKMCDSCRGINTEERLKDSQPKEVKPIYDAKDPESNRKHIIENMC